MKKNIWKALLAVASCVCLCFGAVACGNANNGGQVEQTEMEKVYAQYVIHAEAEGEEPIEVTLSPMTTLVKLLHLQNA